MQIVKFFLSIIFITTPSFLFADLVITEVMYDLPGSDSGLEWVEIQNTSSTSIDVGEWYFFENEVHHGLTPDGFDTLEPQGFAVIVQNLETGRISVGSGVRLVKSSFSLNNTGETLSMSDPEKVIRHSFTYSSEMGANGNGKSLQYYNGEWIEADPTPGKANSNVNTENPSDEGEKEDETKEEIKIQNLDYYTGYIETKGEALARSTLKISAQVSHTKGRNTYQQERGMYFLNLGDGTLIESGTHIKEKEHIYEYPGNYTITLEFYTSVLAYEVGVEPNVFLQKKINIKEPKLSLTDIDARSGISIYNGTNTDVNLSGWNLTLHDGRIYTFPKNSYIQKESTLIVPYTIHYFSGITRDTWISLRNEHNITISSYTQNSSQNNSANIEISRDTVSIIIPSSESLNQEGVIPSLDYYFSQNPEKIRVDFGNNQYKVQEENKNPPRSIPYELLIGLGIFSFILVVIRMRSLNETPKSQEKIPGEIELIE